MATKKELLEQSQKAIGDYFNLSKYLFGDDAPVDVNEIPKDSPFYEAARSLSDEMNLDWDNMSHEDSNRVMLNLLSEYFYSIKVDDKYNPILTISFQKLSNMGLADTVLFNLRPKDLEKASEMFGIEIAILERLNSQRLLNATYIRNLLIRADYERLTSGLHWLEHQDKNYNFPEVMRALQHEYNISNANLKKILHGRNESILFCNRCGIRITKKCYERTDGLCSNCFADEMEL